jgi:hypothetical protein
VKTSSDSQNVSLIADKYIPNFQAVIEWQLIIACNALILCYKNKQMSILKKKKIRKANYNMIATRDYIVINFKACKINRNTRKLVRTFILIKKIISEKRKTIANISLIITSWKNSLFLK